MPAKLNQTSVVSANTKEKIVSIGNNNTTDVLDRWKLKIVH